MKKFYPSSASFAIGTQSQTEKASGCFRNILIKGNGVREPDIDSKYAKMGADFEERILKSRHPGVEMVLGVNREVPFRLDCGDDVVISGRCDFLTDLSLEEWKSSQSDYVRRQVKKGIPVQDHIAQLILYMAHFERDQAFLVYGLYDKEMEYKESVTFEIFITDEDVIEVNGVPYMWSMQDFEAFIKTAIDVLKSDQLLGRPYKALDFMSPCKYCIFSAVCDKLDSGVIKGARAFIKEAQLYIESLSRSK